MDPGLAAGAEILKVVQDVKKPCVHLWLEFLCKRENTIRRKKLHRLTNENCIFCRYPVKLQLLSMNIHQNRKQIDLKHLYTLHQPYTKST